MPVPPTPNPLPSERFDPGLMDRAVIATPLSEAITDETPIIEKLRKKYPKEAKQYNSVILLPSETKITPPVLKKLEQFIKDSARDAGAEPERHQIGKRLAEY